MPDMLVNLLKLPSLQPLLDELSDAGINIRRAQPFEMTPVREFIERNFSAAWADVIGVVKKDRRDVKETHPHYVAVIARAAFDEAKRIAIEFLHYAHDRAAFRAGRAIPGL